MHSTTRPSLGGICRDATSAPAATARALYGSDRPRLGRGMGTPCFVSLLPAVQLSLDAQAAWEPFLERRINKMQNAGGRGLRWASCANTAQELARIRSLTEIRDLVQVRGHLGALDHIPAQTCGRSK